MEINNTVGIALLASKFNFAERTGPAAIKFLTRKDVEGRFRSLVFNDHSAPPRAAGPSQVRGESGVFEEEVGKRGGGMGG